MSSYIIFGMVPDYADLRSFLAGSFEKNKK